MLVPERAGAFGAGSADKWGRTDPYRVASRCHASAGRCGPRALSYGEPVGRWRHGSCQPIRSSGDAKLEAVAGDVRERLGVRMNLPDRLNGLGQGKSNEPCRQESGSRVAVHGLRWGDAGGAGWTEPWQGQVTLGLHPCHNWSPSSECRAGQRTSPNAGRRELVDAVHHESFVKLAPGKRVSTRTSWPHPGGIGTCGS